VRDEGVRDVAAGRAAKIRSWEHIESKGRSKKDPRQGEGERAGDGKGREMK